MKTWICPKCEEKNVDSPKCLKCGFFDYKSGFELTTPLSEVATKFDGQVVTWIFQGGDFQQLENSQSLQYPLALGGVCYAIVLRWIYMISVKGWDKGMKVFRVDMADIPDVYRVLQHELAMYHASYFYYKEELSRRSGKFNVISDSVDQSYFEHMNLQVSGGGSMANFWDRELERLGDLVNQSIKNVKKYMSLYYEQPLPLRILGKKLVKILTLDNPQPDTILGKLNKPGFYILSVEGNSGHALGFYWEPGWFSGTYYFLDPNTALYRFDHGKDLKDFFTVYWKSMLKSDYGSRCSFSYVA